MVRISLQKCNLNDKTICWQILTKGLLLLAGEQEVESPAPTTTTFALPIDSNMAPGFRLLVYHVTLNSELVADSVFVPVIGFNGYEVICFILYCNTNLCSCTITRSLKQILIYKRIGHVGQES